MHESKKTQRILFRCLFSLMLIAASGLDCPALYFLSSSSVSCHAAWQHLCIIRNPTSHACLRHVLHVTKSPGTSWKSFLGQLRPLIRSGSPHLDKLLLSGPRRRQGRPGSASPTRLRLNQLEELSMATLMSLGAVDHQVHQSSSQTDTHHYQTLIIRH